MPLSKAIAFGVLLLALMLSGCSSKPDAEEAREFLDNAEKRLLDLANTAGRAAWIQATYITEDTEALAAEANQALMEAGVELAKEAARFDGADLPPDLQRKLNLLKRGLVLPAPSNPQESEELAKLAAKLESIYGRGEYCRQGQSKGDGCLDVVEIGRIMAQSRNPQELLDVWAGWRTISPPMRGEYSRVIELTNKGARELGFDNTGALWRSQYDMEPDEFAQEVDRLWNQVRPLYESLHTYVRWKLREKYGPGLVPESGPIPAHLLGNIWAQSWEHIYEIVEPANAGAGYDLTRILEAQKTDPLKMVRYGEQFFTSLGFDPLPDTFWKRSMFVKPQDRDVVCHASAWDVDNIDDLRIKMCIEITGEDFATIHHELGHNFYQRAYNQQPFLFRESANDGFHEAVGDAISLSVTPEYLVRLGLLDKAPDASKDVGLLLSRALEKVAFLPFGLLIDQWRWKVFSGEIQPANYNSSWWELRQRYQGVAAPVARTEQDFDPGAKYHVPAFVPYTRYFLAHILQFQFHRALAKDAGCTDPLHRCSIYGNQKAGEKLRAMLAMGAAKPWPEALKAITGSEQMDASAILEYFAPLQKWLDEQNQGKPKGW